MNACIPVGRTPVTSTPTPGPTRSRVLPPTITRTLWLGLTLSLALLPGPSALGQPGTLDPFFAADLTFDDAPEQLAVQSDGRILLAGRFATVNGATRNRMLRLHPDGTLDAGFASGSALNAAAHSVAVRDDGRILIGGGFTQVGTVTRNRVALLESDGSASPEFDPLAGPNGEVYFVLPLPGDTTLVGGAFGQFNAVNRGYLARLRPNGSLDESFLSGSAGLSGANSTVTSAALQSDGRILVAGSFTAFNGIPRNRIARLHPDGSLDTSFDPAAGPNSTVWQVVNQADGSLLIGGDFSYLNGSDVSFLARLNPDGSLDPRFSAGLNGRVATILADGSGRVTIGGDFTVAGGQPRSRIARLRNDGTVDPSFSVGEGFNSSVYAIASQLDGTVLAVGAFTAFNGVPRSRVAQLQGLSTAAGGEIEFAADRFTVAESESSISIEVRRTGNASSPVSVAYATANGTANAGDYVGQSGTLDFAAGETRKTFGVAIRPDTLLEDDETVQLTLSDPTGGAALGAQRTAWILLQNDDSTTTVGGIDMGFAANLEPAAVCHALAVQPDGKIVAGGSFAVANGKSRQSIARFGPDGTVDSSFSPSAWMNASVLSLAVQGDGRILAGGQFTLANGVTRNRLARLRADGTLDPTFDPGAGANGDVQALLVLPTGDIYIGGGFGVVGGLNQAYLARLYSDGNPDPTFDLPVAGGVVRTLLRQPDGRILVGGDFTQMDGRPRNRVARLLPDGHLDPGFDPAIGPNGAVFALGLESDGQVLIGGQFGAVSGAPISYLARLNPDGTLDPSFNPACNSYVYGLVVQPGDLTVAVGEFTQIGGTNRTRVARLRSDGVVDASFESGGGFNTTALTVVAQNDGQLVAGGTFSQLNGITRNRVARILGTSVAPGGDIEFAAATYRASESQSSATIDVRRTGRTTGTVTVSYATANGTANAGDYTPQSDRLTFAAGETLKSFTIPIRADTTVEDDETVWVTLSNPIGGAALGPQRTAVLTLVNDDTGTGAGTVDTGFAAGLDAACTALTVLPDGRTLAVGNFVVANGRSRLFLARFDVDGSLDPTWSASTWFNAQPLVVTPQPDGRYLVAGRFSVVNGVTRNRLARLEADGSLDPTFDPGAGPNSDVLALLVQPSGDIYVGGAFGAFGTVNQPYLVRLFSDGSLDTTYTLAPQGGGVRALLRQPDGRILVAGDFTSFAGERRNRIARLHGDGSLDPSFDSSNGPNAPVYAMTLQSDGQIVVGGVFGAISGEPVAYLGRLNAQGRFDPSFTPGVNSTVYALATQGGDRIVVAGEFSAVGGSPQNRIARLRRDGSLDPSFDTGTGFNGPVYALGLQPDGSIMAGGGFTQYDGLSRPYLTRIIGLNSASGGEIEFSSAVYAVSESQPSVVIEVRRTGNTGTDVRVSYATANGTATAADYTPASGSLTFAAGDNRKSFTIALKPDAVVEDDETLAVILRDPSTGAALGAQRTATVLLLNDDRFTEPGSLDTLWPASLAGPCSALATTPEGGFVATGPFGVANGHSRLRLARFLPDGTLDPHFDPGVWLDDTGHALIAEPDGRTLVGGRFTLANGVVRNRLARFDSTGTLDPVFDPGPGPNSDVFCLGATATGDFIVGGQFSQYAGQNRGYLVRIYTDASLDTTFSAAPNGTVRALALLDDGRMLIGGDFTAIGSVARNRIARLHPDGAVDESFDPGAGANATVSCLALQPDGAVILGGSFGQVAGVSRLYLARLLGTGVLDESFHRDPAFNNIVASLQPLSDGRIVVGGYFTAFQNLPRGYLARLNPDGTDDPTFPVGTGADAPIYALTALSDGGLVLGGNFQRFDGLRRPYLARLQGTALAHPLQFLNVTPTGPGQVRLRLAGTVGQHFQLQTSSDLKQWSTVQSATLTAATIEISASVNLAPGLGTFFRTLSQP